MNIEIKPGNDGIYITLVQVLAPSEVERLNCKKLNERISALAKDLHVSIKVREYNSSKMIAISKYYSGIVETLHIREAERAATTFLEKLRKMEIPTKKTIPTIEALKKKFVEDWEFVRNTILNIDKAKTSEIDKALDITTNIGVILTAVSMFDEIEEPESKVSTAEKK